MSKKVKVVNNIHGSLGFHLNPTPDSFRVLPKQGAFLSIEDEEIDYININQQIIQKGMLWIEDQATRVRLGLEDEKGERSNQNILRHEEIVELVKGNYQVLKKALNEITEKTIIQQFVEVAREVGLDSKGKIDLIEEKAKTKIYSDED